MGNAIIVKWNEDLYSLPKFRKKKDAFLGFISEYHLGLKVANL